MAEKQVIRRVDHDPIADFDDQLWPVNVLLFIFAGFVAGLVASRDEFDNPVLIYNTGFHLAILGVTVIALAIGAVLLGQRMQRRMQLAVLISLLLHLGLFVGLREYILFPERAVVSDVVNEAPPVTLPDYHFQDDPKQSPTELFEKPVDLVVPDVKPPELQKQETQQPVVEKQPTAQPKVEPMPEPTPLEKQRAEPTPPKRSERLSGQELSRNDNPERLPREDFKPAKIQEQQKPRELPEPALKPLAPSLTKNEVDRPKTTPQLKPAPTAEPQQAERRMTSEQMAANSSSPLDRAKREIEEAKATSVQSAASQAKSQAQTQLESAASVTQQQQSRDVARQTSQQPNQNPTASPQMAAQAANRSQERPEMTPLASLDRARQNQPAPTPSATPTLVNRSANAAAGQPSELEATATQVTRQDMARPLDARQTGSGNTSAPATSGVSGAAMARATTSNAANPNVASSATLGGRATNAAQATAGGPTVTSPATSASASQANSAEAATSNVNKATGGLPGQTVQRSFDVGLPGAAATGPTAMVAAQRAQAVQQLAPGTASAPSNPAAIPKSRADASAPSAAVTFTDAPAPNTAGSRNPGNMEADASAATVARASRAQAGRMTAAAGSSTVDLGAPTIVASSGSGRASGGGEPTVGGQPGAGNATAGAASGLARNTGNAPGGVMAGGVTGAPIAAATPGTGQPGGTGTAGGTGGSPAAGLEAAVTAPGRGNLGGASASSPVAGGMASGAGSGQGAGLPAGFGPVGAESGGLAGGGPRRAGEGVPSISGGGATTGTATSGAGLARQSAGGAPAGTGPTVSMPVATVGGGTGTSTSTAPAGSASEPALAPITGLGMGPRRSEGLPVRIAAAPGPGGLTNEVAPEMGLPSRLARPESEIRSTTPARLVPEKTGGMAMVDARVRDVAVPGLRQRDRQSREEMIKRLGGSAATERAVELGLEFLARHQSADGSWSLHNYAIEHGYNDPAAGQMQSSTAATGLALLAFLGHGETDLDGPYRTVVRRGLEYLVSHQQANGDLFVPQDQKSNLNVWLYSHGIAAIALCEAYGITKDSVTASETHWLQGPAQRALNFTAYAQHPVEGGWRYSPQQGSDTSVSGWHVMAMKSGELSKLSVSPETYSKVMRWLDHAQGAGGNPSRYAYRPRSDQAHQREPSRVMTAEALLMRQYLGWKRENPNMIAGAEWLRTLLPEYGAPLSGLPSGQRDAYYWYYATQVMFQMQGVYWEDWNSRLRPLLTETQVQDNTVLRGSWDPLHPLPDRWGREGGRIYVTALNLLMLEVYYRHLPIYKTLNDEK
jgi:hypothetical protein